MAKPLFETTVISNGGGEEMEKFLDTFYQDLAVPKEMGGNGVTE